MTTRVEAVYENGVLRTLAPLPLADHQRVTVTITLDSQAPERSCLDARFVEEAREGIRGLDHVPSLEEVRELVSKDESSWAAAVIAQREDRSWVPGHPLAGALPLAAAGT